MSARNDETIQLTRIANALENILDLMNARQIDEEASLNAQYEHLLQQNLMANNALTEAQRSTPSSASYKAQLRLNNLMANLDDSAARLDDFLARHPQFRDRKD